MTFDIVLEDGTVYPSKGTIVSPDNVVKKTTGTFGIVAEVENTTSGLRSGMPVKVRAALREQKDALLVPARAPLTQGVMDIILIKGKDNAPSAMPIKKGALVTIEVDGVLQPMQIVHIDPALLKQMGYEDPTEVEVIVEGTLPAGMALQANMAAEGRANKLEATPFIYTTPRTVEPSITADKSPTPNLNKF
jgi:multidrug efflux pump subunit AcrA (membrane-fusion protein)